MSDRHPGRILGDSLHARFPLTDSEQAALFALPLQVRHFGRGQDIVREGDRPSQCCVVVEGWLCRYKMIDQGKRQILALQIAGDIPDLQSLYLDAMDHTLGTLTEATVASVPHGRLKALIDQHARIGHAFWRDTLIDASITRQWLANVDGQDAPIRLAHLICELVVRCEARGLAKGRRLPFPLRQSALAETIGISDVHLNRTLQALRRDGLIVLQNGVIEIVDWARLVSLCGFDPTYLHLPSKQVSRVSFSGAGHSIAL